MNRSILLLFTAVFFLSCKTPVLINNENVINEIRETEKAFEKMCSTHSISEAFKYFAADNAVIKRQNDTLIYGKENIAKFYSGYDKNKPVVKWSPGHIDVAASRDLAYSYGKYEWLFPDGKGGFASYKGVYISIWKKQADGKWKFVWD